VLIAGYGTAFHRSAFYQAWMLRIPILFRAETTTRLTRSGSFWGSLLKGAALKRLYKSSSQLLYIGKLSLDHYKSFDVPDHKLIFSPYCVDTSTFRCSEDDRRDLREGQRRELEVNADDTVVLFSGKLISRKGVDLLLYSIKSLPSSLREKVVIVFVGSGELLEKLKVLAQQEPKVRVQFVGFKNQKQLSPYFHAADMLVLPSHYDPWGLVVNEALHHGIPCVVSQTVGCAKDLITPGVTGEVFATGSACELASALRRALELSRVPDIRCRCREQVSRFTINEAARGIYRAYHSV
jgi:glycosyltransferase involved in cell wall biosynthesis